jgi:hypothetical protein
VSKPDATSLREAWQRLHGRDEVPAALSPDFLTRDLAYCRQVARHGGLSTRMRQRLAALATAQADRSAAPASARASPSPRLKPGSTLLREWQGRTYTVLALEAGFELAGQRFRSLSEVAQHITGAHWSGPRFFGLRRAAGSPTPRPARERVRDG